MADWFPVWLTFIGASALVVCTPGPDTALTVRNTVSGGRNAGLATAFGVTLGLALWSLAAAAGITAVILAAEPAFLALKWGGALFLCYLGLKSLWTALRGAPDDQGSAITIRPARPASRYMVEGLVNDLANIKVAAFYVSILPQFLDGSGSPFAMGIVLGLTYTVISLAWLSIYSVVIARARRAIARTSLWRWLEAATGAVLVGLGLRLVLAGR